MDGKRFVANMTGATVRRFGWDARGKLTIIFVQLDGRPEGQLLEVPLVKRRAKCAETGRTVEVEVFALKP